MTTRSQRSDRGDAEKGGAQKKGRESLFLRHFFRAEKGSGVIVFASFFQLPKTLKKQRLPTPFLVPKGFDTFQD